VIVILAALLVPSVASAQDVTGVFGEYVYAHPNFEDVHVFTGDTLNGWRAGVGVPFGNRFGLTAHADGSYGDAFRQGVVSQPLADQLRSTLYTVTAGPESPSSQIPARPYSWTACLASYMAGPAIWALTSPASSTTRPSLVAAAGAWTSA
jgi:hypothetical protein